MAAPLHLSSKSTMALSALPAFSTALSDKMAKENRSYEGLYKIFSSLHRPDHLSFSMQTIGNTVNSRWIEEIKRSSQTSNKMTDAAMLTKLVTDFIGIGPLYPFSQMIIEYGDANAAKEAVAKELSRGHFDTAYQIVIQRPDISSSDAAGEVLIKAAEMGLLKEVETLLANGPMPHNRISRGNNEISNNPLQTLVVLLAKKEQTSNYYSGAALTKAAENGHLEVVKALAKGQISDSDRGLALLNAAKKGHLKVVEALDNGQISGSFRGMAVKYADEKGYLKIVERLDNGQISNSFRQLAGLSTKMPISK